MQLKARGKHVVGRYDWQRFKFSGCIRGKLKSNAIIFNWYWKISGESGGGLFYILTPSPNVLLGGWWMKYDYIDPEKILITYEIPLNRWEFYRDWWLIDERIY